MSSTVQRSAKYLWTSESVTEGHPDKVCDQLSDAVLDWCLSQTPTARVACEASVKSDDLYDWVWIYGEVTPLPPPEIVDGLVRRTLSEIGYTDRAFGTSSETANVEIRLVGQSADIALGVDRALEAKKGELTDEFDTGAGDQGMMIGFACDETPEYMPMSAALSHRLTRRLAEVRKSGLLPWLRPDGKSQVTVEYSYGKPVRVDTIVISTQHDEGVEQDEIEAQVRKHVIEAVVDAKLMDDETRFLINPTGRFVIGGPDGDAGLTGRKIIVDTYGGAAPHGGGAFSGKDPTKVDRSAAYAARYLAKNVVAAGMAERCTIQLSYAIGVSKPLSIYADTHGTGEVYAAEIERAVARCMDLTPRGIREHLQMNKPIYQRTAAYGHFGRAPEEDGGFSWERTDLVEKLRAAV